MRKIGLSLTVFAAILLPVLYGAPAHAQNFHSWVSHSGNDANTCIDTSPCQTFVRALARTSSGGEISCLDSGSFGQINTVTITISVTIDCNGTLAAPTGDTDEECSVIIINAPGATVTLRNLDLNGVSGCEPGSSGGITIQAAAAVNIENCVIENFNQHGVDDVRTSGATRLAVRNTVVRNNTGAGILLVAAAKNSVVLENVQLVGNAYGVGAASGNNAVVSRSVISQNSVAGVYTDPGATVMLDNSVISHNANYGIQANGTVVLANSDIMFNTSSISGPTSSYGNNRIFDNGPGTAPTLISQQ
jgi:uncharacterized Zn-binding protein involved in type VI secretion